MNKTTMRTTRPKLLTRRGGAAALFAGLAAFAVAACNGDTGEPGDNTIEDPLAPPSPLPPSDPMDPDDPMDPADPMDPDDPDANDDGPEQTVSP